MNVVLPLFSRLTGRKILLFPRVIFPRLSNIYFGRWEDEKFYEKLIFKICNTDLNKNALVLSYLKTSGLDTLTLYLVGVLHLLEIQKHYKTYAMSSSRQKKNKCMRFLVKTIIIKLLYRSMK